MKRYGIERQTLLVALIPILVMAVLLENYFVYSRFADLDKAMLERSQLLAHQLATSSEYEVFSGNTTALQQNVDGALSQRDISRVTVLGADDQPLLEGGGRDGQHGALLARVNRSIPLYQDAEVLMLYEPIVPAQVKLDALENDFSPVAAPDKQIGAVIIEISKHRLNTKKNEILLFSLGVTLLILIVTLMLALWAARRITRPIIGMSQAIRRIGEGHLDTRISPQPRVLELNELSAGINQMAQQLQHDRNMLEQRIAEATEELRKMSKAALRASEERLHEIVNVMPVALFVKDPDSRIILMNRACEKQWGVDFAALQNTDASQYFPPEQMAGFLAKDREVFAGRQLVDLEEIAWNAELKENRSVRTFKKPVFDAAGQPLYLIGVSVDITEQKLSEEALRGLNETLEQRIEQRTRELARAKEIAEEASRAKGEFIANMSHEIRTPMNSVLGMAMLALRAETNPKQRDYLSKIQFSGEHLLGVIDSILDFSKIDAGQLKIESVDFKLGAVIVGLANLFSAKAEEKNLSLIFDIDPSIPRALRGDPLRLSQILINFTNNAIKFTEQGEIIIRVKAENESEKYVRLCFEVQDSGIGISKAAMPLLFQTFQQGDSSISRRYGGSGLGLAISKRLAMLMGGEVGVESEAGKGSTFWFRVLLDKGNEEELLLSDPNQEQLALAKIQGARILLAEDSLFNQQIAFEFLKDAGAIVSVVGNGSEALDLLCRQHFDCVLMDMQMPIMDGLEATRRIRADAAMAGTPVIAMTANVSGEDRERCLAAGMDDFVSKPFKPAALYATIAKWLPGPSSAAGGTVIPPATTVLPSDPDIIDLSVLAEMMSDDPDRIRGFAQRFIASAEADIAEIEQALAGNDIGALGALGHRAKSPAKMVGAAGFFRLCQSLENCACSGDLEQIPAIVSQLRPLLQQIRRKIEMM